MSNALAGAASPRVLPEQEYRRASNLARQALDSLDRREFPEAEARLREALAIVPDKATWLYNLACVVAMQGRPDDAMDLIVRATQAGFTDFTHLERDMYLGSVRELPRFKELLRHKDEIRHHAALLALAQLKARFGEKYLYGVDEEHKLIFAAYTDRATLDELERSLMAQAKSQWDELFSHKPDEFIRVVVPSAADWTKLIHQRGVAGIYLDDSRTLIAQRLGQVMVHEFTHALHAADQRALGQEHPIWLREGLASMYEAGEFVEGKLVPRDNYRLVYVQAAGRRGNVIPFEKLFEYTEQNFVDRANLAYGESSSLLLYLYEHDQLRPFYDHYKSDYALDTTGRRALEQVTGMSLPELQKAWTQWMLHRPAPPTQQALGGASLGVRFDPENDGLKISLVFPAGPAAPAGLKIGDVIVGFDDHDVRDSQSLNALLSAHKPGDRVTLKVRRGENYRDVEIVLGRR